MISFTSYVPIYTDIISRITKYCSLIMIQTLGKRSIVIATMTELEYWVHCMHNDCGSMMLEVPVESWKFEIISNQTLDIGSLNRILVGTVQ